MSQSLGRSIRLLHDVPSLSVEADRLANELQRVMEERYSLIEGMKRALRDSPDRIDSIEENTSEYRKVMDDLIRWVETEGGAFGLQIRRPDG